MRASIRQSRVLIQDESIVTAHKTKPKTDWSKRYLKLEIRTVAI